MNKKVKIVLLLLIKTLSMAQGPLALNGYHCWLRCIANCLDKTVNSKLNQCENQCLSYYKDDLCRDHFCWQRCRDMTISNIPETPQTFKADYDTNRNSADPGRMVLLQWSPIHDVKLYIVQYKDNDDVFAEWEEGGNGSLNVTTTSLLFRKPNMCPSYSFRVASVSSGGVSSFTEIQTIDKGAPLVFNGGDVPTSFSSTYYHDIPVPGWEIYSPDSILVEMGYELPLWPREDLNFSRRTNINTHLFKCDQGFKTFPPAPTIYSSSETEPKITLQFIPDYVERSCQFFIVISEFRSKTCGTVSKPFTRIEGQMLKLNCYTVKNAPCADGTTQKPPIHPNCLMTNVDYAEVESARKNDNTTSVQIVWDDSFRSRQEPILYYFVNYGEDERYDDNAGAFVGVKMLKNIDLIKTCDEENNITVCTNQTRELTITGIQYEKLYGVTICAMYDQNYDVEQLLALDKQKQYPLMAYELLISSKQEIGYGLQAPPSTPTLVIIILSSCLLVALVVIIVLIMVILRFIRLLSMLRRNVT